MNLKIEIAYEAY